MAKAKKKASKKAKKKTTGGIASYIRKINNAPRVKSKSNKIKDLEIKLKKAKREKASAVKEAQRKYRKLHKC